jgi:hypothetical protein
MAEPSQGDIAAERIASIVIEALEPAERGDGVAYLCATPFAAGQTLAVPLQPIAIGLDCYVAFIDAQPHANWGHACRYLLIDAHTGEVTSHPRRFPAFMAGDDRWRAVYRSSG